MRKEDPRTKSLYELIERLESGELAATEFLETLPKVTTVVAVRENQGMSFRDSNVRALVAEGLKARVVSMLLTQSSADTLILRDVAEKILGPHSVELKEVVRFITVAESAEVVESSRDAVKLSAMAEDISDPTELRIVKRLKSRLLRSLALENIQQGNPSVSLRHLAELEPEFWNN